MSTSCTMFLYLIYSLSLKIVLGNDCFEWNNVYEDSEYYIHDVSLSQPAAEALCRGCSAHLVTYDSQREYDAILQFPRLPDEIWLGLKKHELSWKWTVNNSTENSSWAPWCKHCYLSPDADEPDSAQHFEQCVQQKRGYWFTSPCVNYTSVFYKFNVVCEREIYNGTTTSTTLPATSSWISPKETTRVLTVPTVQASEASSALANTESTNAHTTVTIPKSSTSIVTFEQTVSGSSQTSELSSSETSGSIEIGKSTTVTVGYTETTDNVFSTTLTSEMSSIADESTIGTMISTERTMDRTTETLSPDGIFTSEEPYQESTVARMSSPPNVDTTKLDIGITVILATSSTTPRVDRATTDLVDNNTVAIWPSPIKDYELGLAIAFGILGVILLAILAALLYVYMHRRKERDKKQPKMSDAMLEQIGRQSTGSTLTHPGTTLRDPAGNFSLKEDPRISITTASSSFLHINSVGNGDNNNQIAGSGSVGSGRVFPTYADIDFAGSQEAEIIDLRDQNGNGKLNNERTDRPVSNTDSGLYAEVSEMGDGGNVYTNPSDGRKVASYDGPLGAREEFGGYSYAKQMSVDQIDFSPRENGENPYSYVEKDRMSSVMIDFLKRKEAGNLDSNVCEETGGANNAYGSGPEQVSDNSNSESDVSWEENDVYKLSTQSSCGFPNVHNYPYNSIDNDQGMTNTEDENQTVSMDDLEHRHNGSAISSVGNFETMQLASILKPTNKRLLVDNEGSFSLPDIYSNVAKPRAGSPHPKASLSLREVMAKNKAGEYGAPPPVPVKSQGWDVYL